MAVFGRLAIAVAVTVTVPLVTSQPVQANPVLSYAEIAALSPEEQAAILDPLRAVAAAASTVGAGAWSDTFSGVAIDAPSHTVTIYLTNPGRRADFLAAVQAASPTADLRLARIQKGAYTFEALKAAALDLTARQNLGIESVAVPPNGDGLHVRAVNASYTKEAMQTTAVPSVSGGAASVLPIIMEAAQGISNVSRLRDTPSWISGEAISQTSTLEFKVSTCTSGLPARRNSDGRSFLITAAHCYPDGVTVLTGWENGGRNTIGTVVGRDNLRDAIEIDTQATGQTLSLEWDGKFPGPSYQVNDVTGTAYSFTGDMTCQDGYKTGIECGLLVDNGFVTWVASGDNVQHAGVHAHQVNGEAAARPGDSGGLVFALLANNVRQARGINSAVTGSDSNGLFSTEAPVILSDFGLSLAP
jgi:hypothetical protein